MIKKGVKKPFYFLKTAAVSPQEQHRRETLKASKTKRQEKLSFHSFLDLFGPKAQLALARVETSINGAPKIISALPDLMNE